MRQVCDLSERVGAGAMPDFSALYDGMAERMLGFFARRVRDDEVAHDLWSETWMRAYASRDRCRARNVHEREAWVVGIARKVLSGWYRRGAVERRALARLELERPDFDDRAIAELHRQADIAELRERICAAWDTLPEAQSRALELRVVQELAYDEIARRLSCTEQVVRARVSRGLRALAESVVADGERLSAA